MGRGQDRHAVVELVGRDEARREAPRHRVVPVEELHLEGVPRAVELLPRGRGPVAADDSRVLRPGPLDDPRLHVPVGEHVEAGEAVGRAVHRHEPFPGADEGHDRGLGLRGVAGAAVVRDDDVVGRERAGGEAVRLLDDADVETAGVDEELAQERRRRAPVVVVAAGEDERPEPSGLEEARSHVGSGGPFRRGGGGQDESRDGREGEEETAGRGHGFLRQGAGPVAGARSLSPSSRPGNAGAVCFPAPGVVAFGAP